jgi:hypothetical protein
VVSDRAECLAGATLVAASSGNNPRSFAERTARDFAVLTAEDFTVVLRDTSSARGAGFRCENRAFDFLDFCFSEMTAPSEAFFSVPSSLRKIRVN